MTGNAQFLPYEVAEVDQPFQSDDKPPVIEKPSTPPFGVFAVRNYASVTLVSDKFDMIARYVSVWASGTARVQMGDSIDQGSSLPIVANQGVIQPTQGYRAVTVSAGSAVNVTIVWHDEPIRIWG